MSDPTASAAGVTGTLEGHAGSPPTTAEPGREKPRSLGRDAWEDLRHNWVFWIASVLILVLIVMAIAPGVFTSASPTASDLDVSRQGPGPGAPFGYDLQGRDVLARTIYGARASILVGIFATAFATIVGSFMGIVAGYYGGWTDTIVSRLTDVFFAIPIFLGAILVLTSFPSDENTSQVAAYTKVAVALAIFGWTSTARIMRSSVIQVKQADFVQAARALGASNSAIIRKHVLPNSLTPVIVVATISLGGYIGAEAGLSYLGIGLQPPVISWGIAISDAQTYLRVSPHMMMFPIAFLSITVLAFIMLGDAVREALDPKLR
ncbi:MAG: oligopeptide transport system permease protein [Actinomycetota bacterium]|jgi:oligopeptide transport system permease protein|nr:oligopeptide transport system permease protein [Actinomycetota bacterium]